MRSELELRIVELEAQVGRAHERLAAEQKRAALLERRAALLEESLRRAYRFAVNGGWPTRQERKPEQPPSPSGSTPFRFGSRDSHS